MPEFTIYGERHSGTNFLQKVICENFGLQVTWPFGWKHFGIGYKDEDISAKQDVIILGIARNPYDWIGGMSKQPWHIPPKNKNIKCLISKEWYSISDSRVVNPKLFGQEIMQDRDWRTNKRYKNIFAMRANKLSYMKYDLSKLTPNYYLMTYEELCNNLDKVLTEIGDRFNLKRHKSKTQVRSQNQYTFDESVLDVINNNLNWDIENAYGYHIDQNRNRML